MQLLEGLWIPKEALYTDLSGIEKMVLAEIIAMSKQCKCTISNRQISEYLNFSQRQISRAIKKLIKNGFVIAEYPTRTTRILTPTKIDAPTEIGSTKIGSTKIDTPTEIGIKPLPKLVVTPTEIGTQYNNNINNNITGVEDENHEYWKIRNEYENKFGLIVGKGGGEKLKKLKELFDIFEHELLLEVIQGIREPQNIKSPFPYIEKIAREENAKRIEAKKKKEQADIEAKLNYVYTAEDGISLYKLDINGERQYID